MKKPFTTGIATGLGIAVGLSLASLVLQKQSLEYLANIAIYVTTVPARVVLSIGALPDNETDKRTCSGSASSSCRDLSERLEDASAIWKESNSDFRWRMELR